jgi:enamine deaminase RidA (YjgF/YER057c/UK114 family)
MTSPEERLSQLGLVLPPTPEPVGTYVPYRFADNLLYLSGQGPKRPDGTYRKGRLGRDVSIDEAYQEARLVGLQLLSVAQSALGDLSRVKQVIKLLGMVNAEPDFGEHPKVINGCSDLFIEVFGESGKHARSAIGVGSLPNQMIVEIEVIFLISV